MCECVCACVWKLIFALNSNFFRTGEMAQWLSSAVPSEAGLGF